jgi:pimeloyl-ACP methyl ester carboxylesterase
MTESIRTSQGTFTAELLGAADAPLVVLLHGFPLSRHSWRAQLPALAAAGYRALAPDQRGYSPGVRPDPRALASYRIERLVADVIELADACGAAGTPFHVVGHDWGGQVAWCVSARHPDRVRSLAVFSRPHPAAFRAAYQENRDDQQQRSRHHRAFHDPATGPLLLADGARRLRAILAREKIPADGIDRHLEVLGNAEAMEAALAWYRAAGALAAIEIGPVAAPTLYVWGDDDATVGPGAARATASWVTGPYRFEHARGLGHCVTEEDPQLATRVLLEHLQSADPS